MISPILIFLGVVEQIVEAKNIFLNLSVCFGAVSRASITSKTTLFTNWLEFWTLQLLVNATSDPVGANLKGTFL